ncbi:MAG: hypothetical protein CL840_06915 [Crocinitomicaceae bacterium]|nr:hypothetical protein [Crocinitomicaceae bacterium]|tara:strand:+ start:7510 stop:8025 length:516 start_codon:yes stop_codon:yes gene_type:complete
MSKRALKKYLSELDKEQLEDQVLDLYHRFKEVKRYYDFVFNPKEDKLIEEAKTKISLEYFPTGKRRKAKMRRSVAQKYIKHFVQLGVDSTLILDLMLFNIEIAQTRNREKYNSQESFYRSMLKSFQEVASFAELNGILNEAIPRMEAIVAEAIDQHWFNRVGFDLVLEKLN